MCVFLIVIAGCQENASPEPKKIINTEMNEEEELLEELESITSAVAITSGKKLYAAAEVKQMARFQLESLRKKDMNGYQNIGRIIISIFLQTKRQCWNYKI
ncbi:hypothetical protein ACE1TI_06520 [Alteribacillus sp. JSM 102045]|uniref:hypothetical protein n=1 Tax=Alteribacillus sp. JSM 102045 TaxID=1562101 RepID=UPI0035BF5F38